MEQDRHRQLRELVDLCPADLHSRRTLICETPRTPNTSFVQGHEAPGLFEKK